MITAIRINIDGDFSGHVYVYMDKERKQKAGEADIVCGSMTKVEIPVEIDDGIHAVYFYFTGTGKCNMTELSFVKK